MRFREVTIDPPSVIARFPEPECETILCVPAKRTVEEKNKCIRFAYKRGQERKRQGLPFKAYLTQTAEPVTVREYY